MPPHNAAALRPPKGSRMSLPIQISDPVALNLERLGACHWFSIEWVKRPERNEDGAHWPIKRASSRARLSGLIIRFPSRLTSEERGDSSRDLVEGRGTGQAGKDTRSPILFPTRGNARARRKSLAFFDSLQSLSSTQIR